LKSTKRNVLNKSKPLHNIVVIFYFRKKVICPQDGHQMAGIDSIKNCSLPTNKTIQSYFQKYL
jgi:hypothetical protein